MGTGSTQEEESSDTETATDTLQSKSEQESPEKHQPGDVNRTVVPTRTGTTVLGSSVQRTTNESGGPGATAGQSYTDYDAGPDHEGLAARYGLDFCKRGQAEKVQRLEKEFGSHKVQRWVDEGMTVETMGKPRDMQAFRKRKENRSSAIPADVERQNQASVQRNTDADQDAGPAGDVGAPDEVRRVISKPGTSMDETVQREMESKMGGDFSDVQIHTGPEAAAAADSINARAFTVGNHVAFNNGEYQPESDSGKKILAHELTHVRQQTEGAVSLLPQQDAELPGLGVGGGVHVQPKLEVSSPNEPAEKEAEEVAEAVMKMDTGAAGIDGEGGSDVDAHRKACTCSRCGPAVRPSRPEARPTAETGGTVGGDTESTVRAGVSGSGKPLPPDTRAQMESSMGADFSDVQVHTGPEANEAAQSIQAEAYTMGSDIAFSEGSYQPDSKDGKKLLAHELTHVAQNNDAPSLSTVRKSTWSRRRSYAKINPDITSRSSITRSTEESGGFTELEEDDQDEEGSDFTPVVSPAEGEEIAPEEMPNIEDNDNQAEDEDAFTEWQLESHREVEEFYALSSVEEKKQALEERFDVQVEDTVEEDTADFMNPDTFVARGLDVVFQSFIAVDSLELENVDIVHLRFEPVRTVEAGGVEYPSATFGTFDWSGNRIRLNVARGDLLEDRLTTLHEIGHSVDDFPNASISSRDDFRGISDWTEMSSSGAARTALLRTVDRPYRDEESSNSEQYLYHMHEDHIIDLVDLLIELSMNGHELTDSDARGFAHHELHRQYDGGDVAKINVVAAALRSGAYASPYHEHQSWDELTEYQTGDTVVYQGYSFSSDPNWYRYPKSSRDHMLQLKDNGYAARHPAEEFAEVFAHGWHPSTELPDPYGDWFVDCGELFQGLETSCSGYEY